MQCWTATDAFGEKSTCFQARSSGSYETCSGGDCSSTIGMHSDCCCDASDCLVRVAEHTGHIAHINGRARGQVGHMWSWVQRVCAWRGVCRECSPLGEYVGHTLQARTNGVRMTRMLSILMKDGGMKHRGPRRARPSTAGGGTDTSSASSSSCVAAAATSTPVPFTLRGLAPRMYRVDDDLRRIAALDRGVPSMLYCNSDRMAASQADSSNMSLHFRYRLRPAAPVTNKQSPPRTDTRDTEPVPGTTLMNLPGFELPGAVDDSPIAQPTTLTSRLLAPRRRSCSL